MRNYELRDRRLAAKLTQKQAAALIHYSERAFQKLEAGANSLHPAIKELFWLKTESFLKRPNS